MNVLNLGVKGQQVRTFVTCPHIAQCDGLSYSKSWICSSVIWNPCGVNWQGNILSSQLSRNRTHPVLELRNSPDLFWPCESTECAWCKHITEYHVSRSPAYRINSHFLAVITALLALTEQIQSRALLTVMSNAARPSWISPLLSCVTLLLFCVGFLRVELKIKQQDARLDALEVRSAQQHSVLFGEFSMKSLSRLNWNEKENSTGLNRGTHILILETRNQQCRKCLQLNHASRVPMSIPKWNGFCVMHFDFRALCMER